MNTQNKNEVRQLIQSACKELNFDGHILDAHEAIEILMGTWATESEGGKYVKQLNGGPARGIFQCEKPTFIDIINRCRLVHRSILAQTANFSESISPNDFRLLEFNHKLAVQVARLKYYLSPGTIPLDLEGQAHYYKQYYNTPLGAATVEGYIRKYHQYVL
jgi:hypothetical protein